MNTYQIAVLKGDGIGPEIVERGTVKVLNKAGEKFGFAVNYHEALLGGAAIDATGVPLPEETVDHLQKRRRYPSGRCGRT